MSPGDKLDNEEVTKALMWKQGNSDKQTSNNVNQRPDLTTWKMKKQRSNKSLEGAEADWWTDLMADKRMRRKDKTSELEIDTSVKLNLFY